MKLYIKEWRQYRALSQTQVADQMPANRGNYSRIERGLNLAHGETLRRIADVLKVEVWQLYHLPELPKSASLASSSKFAPPLCKSCGSARVTLTMLASKVDVTCTLCGEFETIKKRSSHESERSSGNN